MWWDLSRFLRFYSKGQFCPWWRAWQIFAGWYFSIQLGSTPHIWVSPPQQIFWSRHPQGITHFWRGLTWATTPSCCWSCTYSIEWKLYKSSSVDEARYSSSASKYAGKCCRRRAGWTCPFYDFALISSKRSFKIKPQFVPSCCWQFSNRPYTFHLDFARCCRTQSMVQRLTSWLHRWSGCTCLSTWWNWSGRNWLPAVFRK
jgi:hypothetical protein